MKNLNNTDQFHSGINFCNNFMYLIYVFDFNIPLKVNYIKFYLLLRDVQYITYNQK